MLSYQYKIPIKSVIEAYKKGMFPMAETSSSKEIYWIEPKKRGVFNLNQIKIPRKIQRIDDIIIQLKFLIILNILN